MNPKLRSAAVALGCALVVLTGLVTNAAASPTWTAKIGSTATGAGTYTAASTSSTNGDPSIRLTDLTTGISITCASATQTGGIPRLGYGLTGSSIITLTRMTANSCTGFGLAFAFAPVGTWTYNAVSYNGSGVSAYALTGIRFTMAAAGCDYTVTGSADVSGTNSNQILSVATVAGSGHVLTVSGVTGCFGAYGDGHTFSIVGSFKVSATDSAGGHGPLTITSP